MGRCRPARSEKVTESMDRNGWKTPAGAENGNGEAWIDALSKVVAQGTSRRSALKLLVGGVVATTVGISLPALRTKTVAASAPALAPALAPAPQAVAPAVALPAAGICPDRMPNGTPPSFNGCGSDYSSYVVPNHFGKADFTSSCNNHDICYSTCNSAKSMCDSKFLLDLTLACGAAYESGSTMFNLCTSQASTYYGAVSEFGGGPYKDAQSSVCKCCEGPICGSTCCNKGESCCNGTCCPEGQFCCNGTCSSSPCNTGNIYCPCNETTYEDEGSCTSACKVTLACFVNICGPVPLGPVK